MPGLETLIPLCCLALIFFALFIYTGIKSYKRRFKLEYDLRNTFPYELNYQTKFLDNALPNILLTVSGLFSIGLFVLFDIVHLYGINIFILIAGVFSTIFVYLLYFIDLKFLKTHMAMMVFEAVFIFALTASIAISNFTKYKDNNDIYHLVLFIITVIIALVPFAIIMNPKLSLDLKLETKVNKDGKEEQVRPKYFVLAFSEWILAFILSISQILIVLTQI